MDPTTQESVFKSYDGTELYFQKWSSTDSKAIVVGVHGLGEHSDCYKFLADALSKKNYSLTMFDHRGHGKSEGKRGVGTIDEFILDLKVFTQVVKENAPKKPFFFIAHSMGALVLTKFLIRNGFSGSLGAVFSSPLLGVTVEIPTWKKKSAGILSKVLPKITLFNEIPHKNLSHDPEVIKFYERDHLRHDRVSAPLFINMLESIDYVFKNQDKLQGSPMLYQLAGQDLVVSRPASERFFKSLSNPQKELIIYENYYHEIYNEVGREKVFNDLLSWLDKRV